jgi:hypothetical protein
MASNTLRLITLKFDFSAANGSSAPQRPPSFAYQREDL